MKLPKDLKALLEAAAARAKSTQSAPKAPGGKLGGKASASQPPATPAVPSAVETALSDNVSEKTAETDGGGGGMGERTRFEASAGVMQVMSLLKMMF